MTCRELLQNPVYCRATDTPERALDIMSITELPAIPVVTGHHDRKFLGMVHAAAIQRAAEGGRLPALVSELVQAAELVAGPDDDYDGLPGEITQRGWAPVPVVDGAGRLMGLLVAGVTPPGRREHERVPKQTEGWAAGLMVAGAMVVGAGVMYLLGRCERRLPGARRAEALPLEELPVLGERRPATADAPR